jgi:hypothetical protein
MQTRVSETSIRSASGPESVPGKEELSVVDLWFVIRKRGLWLMAGLLAGFLISLLYVFFAPSSFESQAAIRIGHVGNVGPIEDIDALVIRFANQYGMLPAENPSQTQSAYLKRVAKVPGQKNIVELTVAAESPEAANYLLDRVIGDLMQEQLRIYDEAVGPLRVRYESVGDQIAAIKAQVDLLGRLANALKETNAAQASVVAIQRSHLYADLAQLERDRILLLQQSSRPFSSPSEVLTRLPAQSTMLGVPVGLAVGAIVGFILAIAAACFYELSVRISAKQPSRAAAEVSRV